MNGRIVSVLKHVTYVDTPAERSSPCSDNWILVYSDYLLVLENRQVVIGDFRELQDAIVEVIQYTNALIYAPLTSAEIRRGDFMNDQTVKCVFASS